MASTLQSKIDKAAVHFKMRDESVVPIDKISVDDLHHVTSIANGQGEQAFIADATSDSKLRLKIDLYILPMVTIIYLLCFIDRANIGNARIAGLEADLNMKGYDFNICLSVFYISYIIFEIPGNILCKIMGPGWFIPACCLGFGICTICTAFVQSFAALCGLRFVLGIFEAAMLPATVYYLSRWYKRDELTFRLSFFIISASLSGAFGGLLASAILSIGRIGSITSWKMIFAIEGIVTVGFGLLGFAVMTDRAETAIWLSNAEKEQISARIKAERIGTTEVLDKFDRKKFKRGIFNPVVLATSMTLCFNNITVHGLSFFLPTIVKTIFPDRTVRDQQLLTVPPYALGTITCLIICYLSWKMDRRTIFLILCPPFSIIGYSMFLASTTAHVRYGATFLPVVGIFAVGALTNSHVSANVVSDTARSSAVATNAMFGNIGGLVSTWAFLPFDGPLYPIGNALNLGVQSGIFAVALGMYFWINRNNKARAQRDAEAELAGKTLLEIQDLDWKHPGFRWHN
uniref:Major facilitator superfamily (MFS) profile domain-containing protein n=1 Tax=Bionectria ochroleuca TaxID=29856 RepID=A0A0B7KFH0_BIOOC